MNARKYRWPASLNAKKIFYILKIFGIKFCLAAKKCWKLSLNIPILHFLKKENRITNEEILGADWSILALTHSFTFKSILLLEILNFLMFFMRNFFHYAPIFQNHLFFFTFKCGKLKPCIWYLGVVGYCSKSVLL